VRRASERCPHEVCLERQLRVFKPANRPLRGCCSLNPASQQDRQMLTPLRLPTPRGAPQCGGPLRALAEWGGGQEHRVLNNWARHVHRTHPSGWTHRFTLLPWALPHLRGRNQADLPTTVMRPPCLRPCQAPDPRDTEDTSSHHAQAVAERMPTPSPRDMEAGVPGGRQDGRRQYWTA
jgi:hypothetical protein